MIILIPLGGVGQRFKDNGYKKPKALIKVFGKPILYYLLDTLHITNELVVIPYNKEYQYFRLEDQLRKDYPDINFLFYCLLENTRGAAETINIALDVLRKQNYPDCPVLCLDGDNYFNEIDVIKIWNGENRLITVTNNNSTPIYSYLVTSQQTAANNNNHNNSEVIDIVEKQKVSDIICTGAYGFESYLTLLSKSQYILDNNITARGEYYTSLIIREMIKSGSRFTSHNIDNKHWICLGTPIQIRQFCNNYPLFSCVDGTKKIAAKRFCFDLDNTLVTYPIKHGDYSSVLPIQRNIDILKYLKKLGHTIIIYTARRMKTHHGNQGKLLADIGKITFHTLEKLEIPFDEIYFGKPFADVYIDDLGVSCFDDLEKELGFYKDKIDPRSFNSIVTNSIETYRKISGDLSPEIYYYQNIPKEIKDLFPIFLDFDRERHQHYTIEKIHGLNASSLYISELLTTENIKHIMNTIYRIQQLPILGEEHEPAACLNIYANYVDKLQDRYGNFDYQPFPGSEQIYTELFDFLTDYEKSNKGRMVVSHGDTVLTNIIFNHLDKIKLIDMRGQLGDTLTIYGDWLYDWSKLYQSLIGYDKILHDRDHSLNTTYESTMIDFFKKYFIELFSATDWNNLKMITKSLLFTLLPMHRHETNKCMKYFHLIQQVDR